MLLWIGIGIFVLLVGIGLVSPPPSGRTNPRQNQRRSPHADVDDVAALIASDPARALALYGTPDDAARLLAEGHDLAALGYHPPPE